MPDLTQRILISLLVFVAAFMLVYFGYGEARRRLRQMENWYHRVLVQQLLIDIDPRVAILMTGMCVVITALSGYLILGVPAMVGGALLGAFVPNLVVRHLEQKRREKLDAQIVDGITTLAAGVRAGLNLVQSMELLVKNSVGPIRQEFAQLLREYHLGLDLNQAMRNASNRIGSGHYRLLFTAIEMHRQRGGDTGESLDRLAESVREIQRLEGKLDAVTAHGRIQARMMAGVTVLILVGLMLVDPQGVNSLFVEPSGRVMLLIAGAAMALGFWWINRIMQVDI